MKDIKGYEGLYAVTKDGKVWGYPKLNWSGRFLKYWLIGHGYKVVSLYKNQKQKKFLVHRLVALNYIPNPKNLREVNHKNANRLDNRMENLEWVTSKQNKQHAIALGLYKELGKHAPKGSQCVQAILNESKVKRMRKMYSTGEFTYKELGNIFGVKWSTVSHIILRLAWKHVK